MDHTIFDLNDPSDAQAAQDAAIIAKQNDRFRSTWGADFSVNGMIVMTQSVAAMPMSTQAQIITAVMKFDEFDADNDPYGDHGFGSFKVTNKGAEITLFWKIDLYDNALESGSSDPTNLAATRRVLTIMQAHEY